MISQSIETILSTRFNKDEFIRYINTYQNKFEETVQLAINSESPISWRAAWILNHAVTNNDSRIKAHEAAIINILPIKKDGHQRELLKLIQKIEVSENLEGKLFDTSVSLWEAIEKSPSLRMTAFKILVKIVTKYPEMKNEISFLLQNHYLDNLSPGIKRSLLREAKKITNL